MKSHVSGGRRRHAAAPDTNPDTNPGRVPRLSDLDRANVWARPPGARARKCDRARV